MLRNIVRVSFNTLSNLRQQIPTAYSCNRTFCQQQSASAADGDSEHEDYENSNQAEVQPDDHIPLTTFQHTLLAFGTGLASFVDPTRAVSGLSSSISLLEVMQIYMCAEVLNMFIESIAVFGEVTAGPVLRNILKKMTSDPEGDAIIRDKPRINSQTIDLEWLASLPADTLGAHYIQFLRKNNVTPDSRLPVRFISDPELAYVMQRYREAHDLFHTITGMPTNMLGEVVVKWIEGVQLGLPMCLTGGLLGATRLRPKQRAKYVSTHLNWALEVGFTAKPLINIYFERHWEEPIADLRQSICPLLNSPP